MEGYEQFQDFFDYIKQRASEKLYLNQVLAEKAVLETYRCLVIKARLNDDVSLKLSLPPYLDNVWHEMILCTEEYLELCFVINDSQLIPHTTRTESDPVSLKNERVLAMRILYEELWNTEVTPSLWRYENEDEFDKRRSKRRKKRPLVVAERPKTFQIFTRCITNDVTVYEVSSALPIECLMILITKYQSYNRDEQRLICHGKQLKERAMTLGEYNISPESTIHLLMRMRGC